MPCKDLTELIRVTLDQNDRLTDYCFAKRSCGQGIGGNALLLDKLKGSSLAALLEYTAEGFLDEFPPAEEIDEFLSLKHLFALQSALEVLTGKEPGRRGDPFAAGEITYDQDETIVQGRIHIDLLTEKIEACGGCGSCGGESDKVQQGKLENAERRRARESATSTTS